jgi:hypothetical protein
MDKITKVVGSAVPSLVVVTGWLSAFAGWLVQPDSPESLAVKVFLLAAARFLP